MNRSCVSLDLSGSIATGITVLSSGGTSEPHGPGTGGPVSQSPSRVDLDLMAARLEEIQVESDLEVMTEKLQQLQRKSLKRRKTSHVEREK